MQSKVLFLLGCIPVRIALAILAYKLSSDQLQTLSIPLFLIGASFLYLYVFNKRLDAPEAGGKTWWSNLRPIHGMLYLTAALYASRGDHLAAAVLGADVAFGLFVFWWRY